MKTETQIAEDYETTKETVTKFREENLCSDDFQRCGRGFRWTDEALHKFLIFLEDPKLVSRVVKMTKGKPARNKRFLLCQWDGEPGKKIPVVVPAKLRRRLIGKPIEVEIIEDANGGRSYRLATLAAR